MNQRLRFVIATGLLALPTLAAALDGDGHWRLRAWQSLGLPQQSG
jgi:hypothetical protein